MGTAPARSALLALIFLGGMIRCGSSKTPTPVSAENAPSRPSPASARDEPEASQDTAGPARAEPDPSRDDDIRVRVDHVGHEPRSALRLQFAAGTQQVQLIRAETHITAAGVRRALTLEGRRTARILEVTSEGTARFSVEVGPLTLTSTEQRAEAEESTESTSAHANSSGEVDSCGLWLNHRVNVDAAEPGALALTATALVRAPDPLPPEAVGSGAVWVVTRAWEDGGGRVEQTTTYELLEANDSAFRARAVRRERSADGREPASESRGEVFQQLGWLFPDEEFEQRSVGTTPDGGQIEIRSRMQLLTQ